jgi:ubiquinone/menaquinone biosynthesis C-methylase UbiE
MADLGAPKLNASSLHRAMLVKYRIQGVLHRAPPRKPFERAMPQPGETIVDWGCGPGRVTIPFAKTIPGSKLVAVDVERLALQVVREKAAREDLDNVYTILLQSHPVAIPTDSVDLVLLIDTLHAVTDKAGLLSDIGRILKPDGRLFVEPGHMDEQEARDRVCASGLFQLADAWGRDMLFVRRDGQED